MIVKLVVVAVEKSGEDYIIADSCRGVSEFNVSVD